MILIPITRPHGCRYTLVVWDFQTGVVIRVIDLGNTFVHRIMFHGDNRTISTLPLSGQYIDTYSVLNGTKLCQSCIPKLSEYQAHWKYKDTIQFATRFIANERLVINIYEVQPTSATPLHVVHSFDVPSQPGRFSFSQVSFHASFVTKKELVIFDIQNQRRLLHVNMAKEFFSPPGNFSPDGCFFVCKTLKLGICVWQNTPTGYISWRSLICQLPYFSFSWSPISTSILCCGSEGIELLHLDNLLSSVSSDRIKAKLQQKRHLFAYSADRRYIATAQQSNSIVTILDNLSDVPKQFVDTKMKIQDIKIVDNVIFVVGSHKLISWNLRTDGTTHNSHGLKITVNKTFKIASYARHLVLSHNCSQLAYVKHNRVFLYDIGTEKTIYKDTDVFEASVQFSLDGSQLWLRSGKKCYFTEIDMEKDWNSGELIERNLEDEELFFNLSSPYGYHVSMDSTWVVDQKGSKLLWLPPNWRKRYPWEIKWDNSFLALLNGRHPEPIIIEFQI